MLIVQSVFCDASSHPPEYSAFQIKASVADILYDGSVCTTGDLFQAMIN